MAKIYRLNPNTLEKQYKNKLSNYLEDLETSKKDYENEIFIFPENIWPNMALDETWLIDWELYTFLINKDAKWKKWTIAWLIRWTKAEHVVKSIYSKTDLTTLVKIKELTIDLANNMDWISRQIAPNALITYDRFHVQQIVSDAVQTLRIRYRWEAIDEENNTILRAKANKTTYAPNTYLNWDTKKQLLARSSYLLYKPSSKWNESQKKRSEILFKEFPYLKKAYDLSMYFRNIYETNTNKNDAEIAFNEWFTKINDEVKKLKNTDLKNELKEMESAWESIKRHMWWILNYFINRSTNASIEWFHSKLKLFRRRIRWVADKNFFFYRIKKYFS